MPTLPNDRIARLIEPYCPEASKLVVDQLSAYLDLLLKWNARTNLTSIREPEEIVQRHFGESLFAGLHLPMVQTVLDFGSGAGFPGIPIQLVRPEIQVTLGESQNKKATFLREAVRSLELRSEVWADRIEDMPHDRHFDLVAMRAVDNMAAAVKAASERASKYMAILTTTGASVLIAGFTLKEVIPLPGSAEKVLLIAHRPDVS